MGRQLKAETSEDVGLADVHSRFGSGTLGPLSTIARAAFVYPGILAAIFIVLVVGGLSGSSIAILSDDAQDPALLFGSPQQIRGDEWDIATPSFVGQMNSGGRAPRLSGVGKHDLSVLGITPTNDWSIAFRPASVVSIFFPVENALAWNWWFPMLISALGFYALAGLCGLGPGLAASVSMLISFSPFVEWWHSGSITGPLGFGSAASFSIIMALRAESRLREFLWSVSGFYWMVAFVLVLYPPFQIATLLALVPITGAIVVSDIGGRRYPWTHALPLFGILGLAVGSVISAFFLAHMDAISAIRGTIYPGARQSGGGGGSLTQLFSGYFSPVLAYGPAVFRGTNLSEIAAPYLLVGESLAAFCIAGWRSTDRTSRNVAVASACSLTLGLLWHQVPVPSSVGRFFLLNSVPPQRVLPLIGISGAFLLAVLVHSQIPRLNLRRRLVVAMGVAAISFGPAVVEALRIRNLIPKFPLSILIAVAIVGAIAIATLAAGPRMWGVAAVVMLVGIGFASVNPLYRGTGALDQSDIAQAIRREGTGATWINYAEPDVEAFLAASGASSLSGVNFYPNADGWSQLLGGMRDELVWNRFVKTIWFTGSNRVELRLVGDDRADVWVSPCAPQITGFGVTNVLARAGTFSGRYTCLRAIDSVLWQGQSYVIYARSS